MLNLSEFRDHIVSLCDRNGVVRLELFGSATRDDFGPQSDVDFLIEMDEKPKALFRLVTMKKELEDLLGRPVDLVMPGAVNNRLLMEYIQKSRRVIYFKLT